ncbi:putative rhamnogalacturonan endolyase [Helianthus annuus]|uniref:rhamnogalacturonan endolyase n=1 Tax=Helianthus annuus TaxID=4232 RepID=A0A251VFN5_HELAN|nr:probable rhamnogalacturonate lyase B [Helianthus annuus]KAF5818654.1 putative rhamnogalacturonan endolyase [Helianthus annuus]KAJ0604905.1 putative rhamnogalacturonan endolyase [Helianthus annuus]KAJ0615544.1 putative rhamnogalacturonan endolyase [Helianthus annuus]KAJ0618921.1 putative rhamnogalacturonan endolyase [Helianthus annuus]KAJ0777375.1 putative rhamnogalacturonan endolyase [Helianthus annuus]
MYLRLLFLSTLSFYIFSADMLYVTRARISSTAAMGDLGVNLSFQENYVAMSNGLVEITLSNPEGHLTGIQYNGVDNLLEVINDETNRGYWDVVWSPPENTSRTKGTLERLAGTSCEVIVETEDQVELSFSRTWNSSLEGKLVPLKIDKRYILLRGSSGFYTYAIYEHLEEWPSFNLDNTRVAFKLRKDKFHYMANSDDRRRDMPLPDDRLSGRGEQLAYPEAVLLVDPIESHFKGEVDDKYQYATELKDLRVHGWICMDPPVGFWQITPSNEFRVGGPIKSELNSHVGPTTLAVFASTHYGGSDLIIKFGESESWKKVFGPIFIYLNNVTDEEDPHTLWEDAKNQMSVEVEGWPYDFVTSDDFQSKHQRGSVSGRLLVQDRFINSKGCISASGAYVGLAPPGDIGSWQRECKKYQFWTKADEEGYFSIPNILTDEYNLYAWVPGFIGDYINSTIINITSGVNIDLGDLVYELPRDGPTLWEIGYPDRLAAEFYIPDPDPRYANSFLLSDPNRFRQYGLWDRYSELYPDNDLVYTVGESDYTKDFFYAHVLRKTNNDTYEQATWTIKFSLYNINENETYTLRIALASAHQSDLQVRVNDLNEVPLFSTGKIGGDNAIARHGIHGIYWLFNIEIPGNILYSHEENSIYLTQVNNESRFQGVMYDYIRLEVPQTKTMNINS